MEHLLKKLFRIAVIDDNKDDRDMVEKVIKSTAKNIEDNFGEEILVETFISPNDLLADLECGKYYSLYLVDIEMEGKNGLELAKEICDYYVNAVVIFITNYIEYAIGAFEVNAYRYIMKSELDSKLPLALQDIIPKLKRRSDGCYILSHYRDYEVILYEDIYYINKEGKNIIFHHKNDISYERKTLKQVLNELPQTQFSEAAKGYIVNVAQIRKIANKEILLCSGDKIPIGKGNEDKIIERVMEYWRLEKL